MFYPLKHMGTFSARFRAYEEVKCMQIFFWENERLGSIKTRFLGKPGFFSIQNYLHQIKCFAAQIVVLFR